MKNSIGFDIIKVILWACKNIYVVGECYGINVIKYNKILLNMYRGDFGTASVIRKEEWEKQCKWIKTNNPEEWRI